MLGDPMDPRECTEAVEGRRGGYGACLLYAWWPAGDNLPLWLGYRWRSGDPGLEVIWGGVCIALQLGDPPYGEAADIGCSAGVDIDTSEGSIPGARVSPAVRPKQEN
jgi:hypothetical protein